MTIRSRLLNSLVAFFSLALSFGLAGQDAAVISASPLQGNDRATASPSVDSTDLGVLWASGAAANEIAPEAIVAYQVGVFRERINAERLITMLGRADFVGYLYSKTLGAIHYWAVLVRPPSSSPFVSSKDVLVAAGFQAVPITKSVLDTAMRYVPDP
jgi:hypothetical protein